MTWSFYGDHVFKGYLIGHLYSVNLDFIGIVFQIPYISMFWGSDSLLAIKVWLLLSEYFSRYTNRYFKLFAQVKFFSFSGTIIKSDQGLNARMKLQFCDRYYNIIKIIKRHDNQRILQLIFELSMIKIAFGKRFELLSCDYWS